MVVIGIFSIMGGRILIWLVFPFNYVVILPFYLKFLTLFVCILGGILGYFLNSVYKFYFLNYKNRFLLFKIFFSLMWFIPFLRTFNLNRFFLKIGFNYIKVLDFGWGEFFGRLNLYNFFYSTINYLKFFNLKIINYFFFSIIYFIVIIYFIF